MGMGVGHVRGAWAWGMGVRHGHGRGHARRRLVEYALNGEALDAMTAGVRSTLAGCDKLSPPAAPPVAPPDTASFTSGAPGRRTGAVWLEPCAACSHASACCRCFLLSRSDSLISRPDTPAGSGAELADGTSLAPAAAWAVRPEPVFL